jgi:tRNA/tmRNA/rRNA uracil-C5-methylase (TrmA/RlmC/RlmD family)
VVVDAAAARRPGAPAIHEVVAGRRWRVGAGSFFQTRADGAEALVATVAQEFRAGGRAPGGGTVVDAYGGVGLLAAAAPGASIVSVESNAASSADAAANLADRDALVIRAPVERWQPLAADAVVADPARRGLGAAAATRLAATGAGLLVLVSCDAGSLGRDAGLLAGHGFRLVRSTVVDLFPHTAHVEVVSRFER